MQVRKFEAPTMAEALKIIKAELGPEAIILSTKNNRKGFGLLSKASVEVTAAVAEKSLMKKQITEKIVSPAQKERFDNLPAKVQSKIYDNFSGYAQERFDERRGNAKSKLDQVIAKNAVNKMKYADISDEEVHTSKNTSAEYARNAKPAQAAPTQQAPQPKIPVSSYASMGYAPISESLGYSSPQPQSQMQSQQNQAMQAAVSMEMQDELQKLKNLVSELKSEQSMMTDTRAIETGSDVLNMEFQNLIRNGIEKKYASQIIKHVSFSLTSEEVRNEAKVVDALAFEIMSSIKVQDVLETLKPSTNAKREQHAIALIGPTGVGKTTTIAKIASQAILHKNLKVGLINVDSYKVAALDQMATYAKILNVPFRQASTPAELERALAEFKPLDLILIDTSGRSQRDTESLNQLKNLLDGVKNLHPLLILSSTTRDQELYDVVNRFKIFTPNGLIFSKLDESTTFGSVYNVAAKTGLPLNYFTVGQRVPEDIEHASRERLAALILDL